MTADIGYHVWLCENLWCSRNECITKKRLNMSLIKSKESSTVPGLFSDFFSTDFFNDEFFNRPVTRSVPAANVKETPAQFQVEVSAPGMTKDDFKIEIHDDVLNIEGTKEEEKNETNERYTRKEFRTTSFVRSFRLPQNVVADKIDAKYENGILKLVLPKREETKTIGPKQVKIS
jgi:HSP20 family protein